MLSQIAVDQTNPLVDRQRLRRVERLVECRHNSSPRRAKIARVPRRPSSARAIACHPKYIIALASQSTEHGEDLSGAVGRRVLWPLQQLE